MFLCVGTVLYWWAPALKSVTRGVHFEDLVIDSLDSHILDSRILLLLSVYKFWLCPRSFDYLFLQLLCRRLQGSGPVWRQVGPFHFAFGGNCDVAD
ncbi:uncharacterized protein IWZ02DRAFT_145387 [Phyllosticta citriasiana]|uniref:uncharacterized protein n=1 Tax=Phyllosticta citriasiana TaxID=595635 RepID=UPI0030FD963F